MTVATILPLVFLACGSDAESGGDDDETIRQLEGIAGAAIGAYASTGPEALADYISEDALERCPAEALAVAFAAGAQPTGFKEVKDVEARGDEATATVVVLTTDGDREEAWRFVRNETSWRIDGMPGLENCS